MREDYLEDLEMRFPDTFDEILRLAIATKLNVQNLAQVFDLDQSEAVAIMGAAAYMLKSERVTNVIDEVNDLLGDDEFFEDDDDGDDDLIS